MSKKYFRYFLYALVISTFFATRIFAATTGTIDPNNSGDYAAAFVHAPNNQAGSAEINFGKFTNEPNDDITISAGSLHGFAWSPVAGWIVMNCANTNSGCSSSNQNFKVAIDANGVLSGYAWGQQTGWINFGPFVNNATPQIKISTRNGSFGGTSGTSGYAWSEMYGWIVFDCSSSSTCVTTDYGITTQPTTGTSSSVGITSGGSAVTSPQPILSTPPSIPTNPTYPVQNPTTQNGTTIPSGPGGNSSGTISGGIPEVTTVLPQPTTIAPRTGPKKRPSIASVPPEHVSYSSILRNISTFIQKIVHFVFSIPHFIYHFLFPRSF